MGFGVDEEGIEISCLARLRHMRTVSRYMIDFGTTQSMIKVALRADSSICLQELRCAWTAEGRLGERLGSGDGERKTLLTRQIAFEQRCLHPF